jgi:hypothetical protein
MNVSNKREQNDYFAEREKGATKLNDFELEDMRQQMAVLKQKLEQQEIVSEQLIRQSIREKVTRINQKYKLAYYTIPVILFLMVYSAINHYLPQPILIATGIYIIVTFAYMIWAKLDLRNSHVMTENLLETQQKVALAKQRHRVFYKYDQVLLAVWLIWETIPKEGVSKLPFICAMIGLAGAILMGIRNYRKAQSRYQEILEQIEDLKSEQ